jgi:hypothetical protein
MVVTLIYCVNVGDDDDEEFIVELHHGVFFLVKVRTNLMSVARSAI